MTRSEFVDQVAQRSGLSRKDAAAAVDAATGEKIQIAASRVPRFTAGSGLKKAVKGG